jgi:hypothetical protein
VRTFHPSEDADQYISPLDRPRRSCPTERLNQEQRADAIDKVISAQARHMAAEQGTPRLPEGTPGLAAAEAAQGAICGV